MSLNGAWVMSSVRPLQASIEKAGTLLKLLYDAACVVSAESVPSISPERRARSSVCGSGMLLKTIVSHCGFGP